MRSLALISSTVDEYGIILRHYIPKPLHSYNQERVDYRFHYILVVYLRTTNIIKTLRELISSSTEKKKTLSTLQKTKLGNFSMHSAEFSNGENHSGVVTCQSELFIKITV